MKICVWRTGHEIADTVYDAILEGFRGLSPMGCYTQNSEMTKLVECADIHIGYGILRGMADVFRECDRQGKSWFCIDRGYWNPGHYDGYYRVSLRGAQQTSGWPAPDWDRWKALGVMVEPEHPEWKPFDERYTLVVPPSDYVREWLNLDWKPPLRNTDRFIKYTLKGATETVDERLDPAGRVVTFNSALGWEALRRGIPVESDPVHSIVGAWQAKHGTDKREELFATMAGLQLTLDEMRSGKLMPLMEKLLERSSVVERLPVK